MYCKSPLTFQGDRTRITVVLEKWRQGLEGLLLDVNEIESVSLYLCGENP